MKYDGSTKIGFPNSVNFGDKLMINFGEGIDVSSKNGNRQKDKLIIHPSCVRAAWGGDPDEVTCQEESHSMKSGGRSTRGSVVTWACLLSGGTIGRESCFFRSLDHYVGIGRLLRTLV
jgi:hypothetical protein